MTKEKLYFKSIDDTICSSLESHIEDAKNDGLKEIKLIEAIPYNGNSEFIWCKKHVECIEKELCKKSICTYYDSKSGRGTCKNKGQLYLYGEEVTFPVLLNINLKDIVYLMYNNLPTECIVVSIVETKSVHPYGLSNIKIGICIKKDFETERKNSGVSRRDNPLPYVDFFEKHQLFKDKETLLKSLL